MHGLLMLHFIRSNGQLRLVPGQFGPLDDIDAVSVDAIERSCETFLRDNAQTYYTTAHHRDVLVEYDFSRARAIGVIDYYMFMRAFGVTMEPAPVAVLSAIATDVPVTKNPHSFIQLWELLGFLFSKDTRERYYEPSHYDMLVEYLRAAKHKGKWTRRWLTFCFTFRTFKTVAGCLWIELRLLFVTGALALVLKVIRAFFRVE